MANEVATQTRISQPSSWRLKSMHVKQKTGSLWRALGLLDTSRTCMRRSRSLTGRFAPLRTKYSSNNCTSRSLTRNIHLSYIPGIIAASGAPCETFGGINVRELVLYIAMASHKALEPSLLQIYGTLLKYSTTSILRHCHTQHFVHYQSESQK